MVGRTSKAGRRPRARYEKTIAGNGQDLDEPLWKIRDGLGAESFLNACVRQASSSSDVGGSPAACGHPGSPSGRHLERVRLGGAPSHAPAEGHFPGAQRRLPTRHARRASVSHLCHSPVLDDKFAVDTKHADLRQCDICPRALAVRHSRKSIADMSAIGGEPDHNAVAFGHGCVMLHASIREARVKTGLDNLEDLQPTTPADVVVEVRKRTCP